MSKYTKKQKLIMMDEGEKIMITGKYVGTITINFCFDENTLGNQTFEEVKKEVESGQMNNNIEKLLKEEIDDLGELRVEQKLAKLQRE